MHFGHIAYKGCPKAKEILARRNRTINDNNQQHCQDGKNEINY